MYFTGALDAKIVLVHLNPKLSPLLSAFHYPSFETYLDEHRRFGYHHWEKNPKYRSMFDQKQVRFLKPFGVIDFRPDSEPGHERRNPALAIDKKLQLELIPYATATFDYHNFSDEILKPHFDRILGVIAAYPRDYVIFCGAVFDRLLSNSNVLTERQDHRFRLPTSKGTSVGEYRFSNVEIRYGDSSIRAGIARSFATQGMPMAAYGAKCRELYNSK
jgi:hypothetical protein